MRVEKAAILFCAILVINGIYSLPLDYDYEHAGSFHVLCTNGFVMDGQGNCVSKY